LCTVNTLNFSQSPMKSDGMSTHLEENVYYRLREMILSGELVSGEKLVQEDLSARLGVSRTPLRTAISRLNSENFVRISSRGEASVSEFGLRQIAELFEIRAVLEGLICRLLAPKIELKHTIYLRSLMASVADAVAAGDDAIYREADVEFHTYLTSLIPGGNLGRLLEPVHTIMRMSLSQGILRSPAETHPEHLAIIDALEARDSDEAERAMINHIRKTIALLQKKAENESQA